MTSQELEEAQRVARLIAGHISNNLDSLQEHDLDEWISESDENMLLFEKLTDPDNIGWAMAWFKQLDVETALQKVNEKIAADRIKHRRKLTRVAAWTMAAAIIGIAGLFVFKALDKNSPATHTQSLAENEAAIPPGTQKAALIVGRERIDLAARKGQRIRIGNSIIANYDNVLTYDKADNNIAVINTLQVPAGGEYQVVLPDGTRVWLNAASSLTYPTAFVDQTRTVELRGEGYFEVSHDPKKPFIVHSRNMEIAVKGTHFNVDAYSDSIQRTSLLEGKIMLSGYNMKKDLQPGQEGIISENHIIIRPALHIADAVAWTKGIFSFHQSSIDEVMQQVAKWYNISVEYEEKTTQQFTGQIYRNSTLQQVLEMLELSGNVHFKVQGRKVRVTSH